MLATSVPGGSARVLSEAMLLLSISDSPQLATLLSSARSVFAPAGGVGGGGGGFADGSGALSLSTPGGRLLGSSAEFGQQQQQQQQPFGPGKALAPSPSPAGARGAVAGAQPHHADLGLLGDYLLARWREDAARSAAAAARSHAL